MTNTYIDCFDYTRSTSGLEWQSLVGNMARFTTSVSSGSSSLTIPAVGNQAITTQLNQFDRITIFDGSQTEIVTVASAGAAPNTTAIPLTTPTQFTHAAGVPWCSDGAIGSLSDQIVAASVWFEQECYQSLLLSTWTNEALTMPSLLATIANDGTLTFRPRHWPINSISALTLAYTPTTSVGYDPSQVFVDGDHRLCMAPKTTIFPASVSSNMIPAPPARSQFAQLLVTYSAGFAYATMPYDIKEAVILITADMLAKRHNPIGAPDVGDGSTRISAIIRGEKTGESLLIKRARMTIEKYRIATY